MNGILAHPKNKQEARLITELFDKMNIAYENENNEACRESHVPNKETLEAMEELQEEKPSLKGYTDINKLLKDLLND